MATVGGLALATLALHLRDPHQDGSWGFCPLHATTGLSCPGCGGLRAVNDLTNGEVGAALSSNLLVTLGIPVAVVLLAVWGLDRWTGHSRLPAGRRWTQVAVALAGLFAVFTVVRNLPFGGWLAP